MVKNAIILAAGQGSRLRSVGITIPKCLLEVGDQTILERTLDGLEKVAVGQVRVTIVVGYEAVQIMNWIGNHWGDISIEYIVNQNYKSTNNIYSLWLAREELSKGPLIVESDIVTDPEIFNIININRSNWWGVKDWTEEMDGSFLRGHPIKEMKIIRESIDLDGYKSCGILKFCPEGGKQLAEWLDREIKQNNTRIYYDQAIAEHLSEIKINPYWHGKRWIEIDTPKDLKKAREIFE